MRKLRAIPFFPLVPLVPLLLMGGLITLQALALSSILKLSRKIDLAIQPAALPS